MKLYGNKFRNFDWRVKCRVSFYRHCVNHERDIVHSSYLSLLAGTYHRPLYTGDWECLHKYYHDGLV